MQDFISPLVAISNSKKSQVHISQCQKVSFEFSRQRSKITNILDFSDKIVDEEFDGCDINVLSHPSSFYVVMEQPKINGLNERNDNLPDLRKRSTCIMYVLHFDHHPQFNFH